MDWKEKLSGWASTFDCRVRSPLSGEQVADKLSRLGNVPGFVYEFYRACNGLESDWFVILPLEDASDMRRTWNSIGRANDVDKTRFLGGDPELLERFLVFASLSGLTCAVVDRQTGSIWFEEDGDLHETDMALEEFIEVTLKEVRDL